MVAFSLLHASNAQNYYRYGKTTTQLSKRAIVEIAKGEVRRLVLQKKIPKSWKFSPLKSIEKNQNNSHWIVLFENLKMKHQKNQSIYIEVDTYGNIISVSYKPLATKSK